MAFGNRVRDVRKALQLSQQQLADMVGVNQPVIGSIESRDSTNSKHAPTIAKCLNVSLEWLLTGAGFDNVNDAMASQKLNAGNGIDVYDESKPLASDEIESLMHEIIEDENGVQELRTTKERLRLPKTLLEELFVDKAHIKALKYNGDDMKGKIEEGSTIAVDLSKAKLPINNNKIYLIKIGGKYKLRMLQLSFDERGVEIQSSNDRYKAVNLPRHDFESEVEIIGWVFWWSSFVKW